MVSHPLPPSGGSEKTRPGDEAKERVRKLKQSSLTSSWGKYSVIGGGLGLTSQSPAPVIEIVLASTVLGHVIKVTIQ